MSYNAYWYVGLALVGVILLVCVLIKQRNLHTVLQFLIHVEIAYLIEAVIYIFLGSYIYHPKIIKSNAYYDSHMGALASNLLIIPVIATIISVFQLRWVWIIMAMAFFWGIEWLFIKLDLYTLHWWRMEYTLIGLLMYFPLGKIIYRRIIHPLTGFLHAVVLFLCIGPISGTLHFLPIMLFSNRVYRPGWFENVYYDTSAFAVVYYICVCIVLVLFVKLIRLHKWLKFVLTALVTLAVTYILKKTGILYSHAWWDTPYYVLAPPIVLLIAELFSKRLYEGSRSAR